MRFFLLTNTIATAAQFCELGLGTVKVSRWFPCFTPTPSFTHGKPHACDSGNVIEQRLMAVVPWPFLTLDM